MGSARLFTYPPAQEELLLLAEEPGGYRQLDDAEAAYLAGIIDGEGTIGIYDLPGTGIEYHLRLIVSNTFEPLIDWVHARIGGSKRCQLPRDPRYRPSYQVQVVQQGAARVIRRCLPYLIVKRDQALLGLEFIDGSLNCRGRSVPETELQRRRELAERISALNQAPGVNGVVRRRGRKRNLSC